MSSVGQRFDKFLSNIQLTDTQVEDAITKHHGVRKVLHEAYYTSSYRLKSMAEMQTEAIEFSIYKGLLVHAYKSSEVVLDEGYVYQSSLLVGSYGKSTAIAPPSDIDILFQLPFDQFSRYDSYKGNGQSQLLQDVKKILQNSYPKTNIRADGQIVFVPFSSYKIEVLPAFKLSDGSYWYPDTHSGGSWKRTNPKAEIEEIRESNKRSGGNTVKLIKMIKAWKHHCDVKIASLVIELRAVNFLRTWAYYDRTSTYYDWMMRDFFSELLNYVDGHCKIPGIEEEKQYGNAWKSDAEMAAHCSRLACEYELSGDYVSATTEWKKIFGSRFWYLFE
jgi:hypothetical protein